MNFHKCFGAPCLDQGVRPFDDMRGGTFGVGRHSRGDFVLRASMLPPAFLQDNGWGPRCGCYLKFFGHDFHAYIHAHGFATLTDATITYMVDSYYNPSDELGVVWNDPEIAADWGVDNPTLSERDQSNPLRNAIPEVDQPRYGLRN